MSAPVATGDVLPERRLGPIDDAWVARYAAASLDDNPIHSDPQAARAVGLDGPIVQGMLFMGQFEALIGAWRGDLTVTSLDAKFLRPVLIGQEVVIAGRVVNVSSEASGTRAVIRLTVRTADGGLACRGEAQVRA